MSDPRLCAEGHVVDVGRETCERCNGPVINEKKTQAAEAGSVEEPKTMTDENKDEAEKTDSDTASENTSDDSGEKTEDETGDASDSEKTDESSSDGETAGSDEAKAE